MSRTKDKVGNKKARFAPNWFVNNLKFIVFLTLLGLTIIFNSHRAEKKLVKIHDLKSEIREMEYEHSSLKKELKSKTVMSKLVEDLNGTVVFPEKGPILIGPDKS